MPPMHISEIEYDDIPAIVRFDRDAFHPDEHPYMDAIYPNRYTEEGLQNIIRRWQSSYHKLQDKQHMKVLKVTDTTTGEILASGRWSLPCSGEELNAILRKPQVQGPYWADEEDRAWAEYLSDLSSKRRREALQKADGQLFVLLHLAVHPDHQGSGVGSGFVEWGTSQADELGVECCVESSVRAEKFYATKGFMAVERCSFPPPARWHGKGVQEYVWMVRPAKQLPSGGGDIPPA